MRLLPILAALAVTSFTFTKAQQYAGDVIPNSLPGVPGSEITFFRINDPSGKNKNLTLTNYYSHDINNKRLVESNVQRAIVIIHGMNRDPGTYMSNMLSALSQTIPSDPNVNFSSVAIMAPYFPNGDDKTLGYPFTDGLSAGKGSTSNALVWKSSQWSAGGNNQYPYTSKNISSYNVLDQIIQYFDNATLFPKMNQIVIAGHSLGGQTVQRYAAIGAQLNTRTPVSYWVANPNSYAWLSTDRPLSTAGCPDYDAYREGYYNFTDYPMTYGTSLVASGRAAIQANYNRKAINYARGTQDLGDDSSTCAPFTTGKDRNERFFNFIKSFPPTCTDPKSSNCDTVDFVNAGHDASAMMAAPAGQARLFTDNFYGNGNRSYDFGYPRQQAGDDPYPNPSLNSSSASVNNQTYAGNMTYWGCWSDQTPQTLTNLTYTSNANTVEKCTQTCAQGGNTIAGLEAETQCFCGKSLGYEATQVVESSCQFACPGNSSETCGGNNRLSLFSNGRPNVLAAPGNPETIGSFYYISCYTEASSGRALTGQGTSSNSMTLEYCANYCSGHQYFGTEYGSECYCGNSFTAGANRTSDSDCSMLCANATSEFCGAANRLTVYQDPDWTASASSSSSSPSATSTGVSCPASNNTIATSGSKDFTIECGVDHQYGDLTSLGVNSFQQCIDACAQNAQCVDVSLSGTACYLKSLVGVAVPNGAIWGARLVVSSSTTTGSQTTSVTTGLPSGSGGISTSSIASGISSTGSSGSASSLSTGSSSASSSSVGDSTASLLTSTTTDSSVGVPSSSSVVSTPLTPMMSTTQIVSSTSATLSTSSPEASSSTTLTTSLSLSLSISASSDSATSSTISPSISGIVPKSTTVTSSTASIPNGSISTTSNALSNSLPSASSSSIVPTGTSASGTTSSIVASPTGSISSTLPFPSSSISSVSSGSMTSSTTTSSISSATTTISTSTATPRTASTVPSSVTTLTTSTSASPVSSTSTIPSPTTPQTTLTTLPQATTSSSVAPSPPSGFSPLGCYVDIGPRALPTFNGSSSLQTPQQCALNCQALGLKYSGTEYGSECWCGNTLPAIPAVKGNSECSMPCKGDKNQKCGAGYRLSVVEDTSWKQTFFVPFTYRGSNTLYPSWDYGWSLNGCYIAGPTTRALPHPISLSAYGGAANSTVGNCLDACRAKGYYYCGLEYYGECWAGNTLTATMAGGGDEERVLSAGCSFPCRGNLTESCGGSNRLQVYQHDGGD